MKIRTLEEWWNDKHTNGCGCNYGLYAHLGCYMNCKKVA